MGEVAEMMLDGTLCESCGVLMDDVAFDGAEPPGHPRKCRYCTREAEHGRKPASKSQARRFNAQTKGNGK